MTGAVGCCYDVAPWPYGPPGYRTGALGHLANVPGAPLDPALQALFWEPTFGALNADAVAQGILAVTQVGQSLVQARAAKQQAAADAAAATRAQAEAAAYAAQQAAMARPSGGTPGWAVGLGVVVILGGLAAVVAATRTRKGK